MRLKWSPIYFLQFIIKRLTFKSYCLILIGGQIFVGNGYCDDGLNTAECNFDAGDCCDPSANTDYCSICQCLSGQNGTTQSPQTSSGNTGLSSSSFTTRNIWTSHSTVVDKGMKIQILEFELDFQKLLDI